MTATERVPDRLADIADMARSGVRTEGAAMVTFGWTKRRKLKRYLERHGRIDLWYALLSNDRRPNRWEIP